MTARPPSGPVAWVGQALAIAIMVLAIVGIIRLAVLIWQ